MKTRLYSALALILASSLAWAFQCPKDIRQLDQALEQQHGLDADQVTRVKELRDQGESLHKSGRHQESVDTLAQALAMLGLK